MKLSWIVHPFLAAGVALIAALGPWSPSSLALQEGGGEPAAKPDEKSGKKDESEDKKKKDEEERWFAVVHGDVYTGTGAVLRDATVLSRNGVIDSIGHEVDLPPGTETLDATGLRVYPGLVAINSVGLVGGGAGDFADTVDPFNSRMVLALASGLTTTGQSNTALKLKRREIEGVVLREKFLSTVAYSNGKREWIEKFDKAAKYLREYRDWEEKKKEQKDLKEPPATGVDSTARAILEGKVLARFNASTREDLLDVARLAQRYGFRPVIDGCVEGWTVADELGRAGAYAVITPRDRRDKEEQLVRPGGSSIENAAILHRSGVQICVTPATVGVDLGGIAGRDILHLAIEAGFAVRGGLSDQSALEAITIVPARILGVAHRVGSLEVGKDCDLIVTDGDVLHYQTLVQWTVVEGKIVYDKTQELYFAHIRPRPTAALAPEERQDPGEKKEGAQPEEAQPDEPTPEEPKPEEPKPEEPKPEEPPKDG